MNIRFPKGITFNLAAALTKNHGSQIIYHPESRLGAVLTNGHWMICGPSVNSASATNECIEGGLAMEACIKHAKAYNVSGSWRKRSFGDTLELGIEAPEIGSYIIPEGDAYYVEYDCMNFGFRVSEQEIAMRCIVNFPHKLVEESPSSFRLSAQHKYEAQLIAPPEVGINMAYALAFVKMGARIWGRVVTAEDQVDPATSAMVITARDLAVVGFIMPIKLSS